MTSSNMIENQWVTSPHGEPAPQPADLVEAARQLRTIVAALPSTTARDRATARRIQGAAVALEALTSSHADRASPRPA